MAPCSLDPIIHNNSTWQPNSQGLKVKTRQTMKETDIQTNTEIPSTSGTSETEGWACKSSFSIGYI